MQHRKEDHPRRFSADSASSDVISKGKAIEKCSNLMVKERCSGQGLSVEKELKKEQCQEIETANVPVKRRGRPTRSETVSKSRGRATKACDEPDGTPKKKHVNKKQQHTCLLYTSRCV